VRLGLTSPSRAEAFADGVFAVAITLLVLDLKVPSAITHGLGRELLDQWPNYAAFVVSFLTIGIIWLNHHSLFDRLTVVDRPLLLLNLLFLLSVCTIPFPTAVLAASLRAGQGEAVGAGLYGGTMAVMGLFFALMWVYAVRRRLVPRELVPGEAVAGFLARFAMGGPIYAATIGLSVWQARWSLAVYAALALYYAAIPTPGRPRHALGHSQRGPGEG
jgi:uncharacterized membrane protein